MTAFALPDRLAAKAETALIEADDRHFAAIEAALERTVAGLRERRREALAAPAGTGQEALERDLEIHRLGGRLRALQRFGIDLCLGRMVPADGGEPVYIGRLGLADDEGAPLLVDWRSPAAAPFFGATHATPMGLVSRRRYRWTRGRVTDYWDEVFTADGFASAAALDDQSAFIASLGASRSGRMRDVLGTIQADQDAIVRAGSRGALVVDGGPGTGKTVVALHRTAYLLYSEPRLARSHGGVLLLGPNPGYLAYVADVLPSLGEEGVQAGTIRDLVPEGVDASPETDPAVAALKGGLPLVRAVEAAVRRLEQPPVDETIVETEWLDLVVGAEEWAEAFDAVDPDTPHNEAREEVWRGLVEILARRARVPARALHRELAGGELRATLEAAWPLVEATDLVAELWSSSSTLRTCAPGLTVEEVAALQRPDPRAWTVADLPLIDAARYRLGDPGALDRERRRSIAETAERERMSLVLDDLMASQVHDDGEGLMSMLRGADVRNSLLDEAALPGEEADELAGPFGHVVVDEAQELTDAEWRMLLRRCPSRSMTIVGDRAQARRGFPEPWAERLERVGLRTIAIASLSVNYRTPREIMTVAEPVIRRALPDANVPASIRDSGLPVRRGPRSDLAAVLTAWEATSADGVACVIGDASFAATPRVRSLSAEASKGLEFDLVVIVEPSQYEAVDLYVAMTRATSELVMLAG